MRNWARLTKAQLLKLRKQGKEEVDWNHPSDQVQTVVESITGLQDSSKTHGISPIDLWEHRGLQ